MTDVVVPVYLAFCTSMSSPIERANDLVADLSSELTSSPILGEHVRVALLAFSKQAELVLPLADLSMVSEIPRLTPGGEARYAPIFELLAKVVKSDLRVLQAQGLSHFRPIVFMVSNVKPVDSNWEHSFDSLQSRVGVQLALVSLEGPVPASLAPKFQVVLETSHRDDAFNFIVESFNITVVSRAVDSRGPILDSPWSDLHAPE